MTTTEIRARSVRSFSGEWRADWDDLVARSANGTFLHTREFLAYHGDRFRDRSLVVTGPKDRLAGVFPAAEDPDDPTMVVSHPGLTYGGLVHDGSLSGPAMLEALTQIAAEYRAQGYTRLRYKPVPSHYHARPAGDDLYALFRLGARRDGCDLAAVIDLAARGKVRADRQRGLRVAGRAGVTTEEGWQHAPAFWRILEDNLAGRHGAAPTHSLAQIGYLHDRFGEQITLVAAKAGGEVVAGCLFFAAGRVLHGQYTAASPAGRQAHATDLAIEHGIGLAADRGFRYISFGTSTHGRGAELNESQYDFKCSFGAGGAVHEHYRLTL
jgi:hypothetical protein